MNKKEVEYIKIDQIFIFSDKPEDRYPSMKHFKSMKTNCCMKGLAEFFSTYLCASFAKLIDLNSHFAW